MTLDDIQTRFLQEIRLRSFDDHYIDPKEEREVLTIAVQHDLDIEYARLALIRVCEKEGHILESRVRTLVKDYLDVCAAKAGHIDEADFDESVERYRKGTKKTELEAQRFVQGLIAGYGYKTAQGWLVDWFSDLTDELKARG